MRRILMVGALASMTACGPYCGDEQLVVSGRISLAPDVDPTMFSTLEIRLMDDAEFRAFSDADDDWLTMSEPLDEIEFPYAYGLSDETIRDDAVVAWLAAGPAADRPGDEDPQGAAAFELCACATHVPPYAHDVDIVIAR